MRGARTRAPVRPAAAGQLEQRRSDQETGNAPEDRFRRSRKRAGKTNDERTRGPALAVGIGIGRDLRSRRRDIARAWHAGNLQDRLIGHLALLVRRRRPGRAGGIEPYDRRIGTDSDGYVAAVDAAVGIRNARDKEKEGENCLAEAAQQRPGPRLPASPTDGPFAHAADLRVSDNQPFLMYVKTCKNAARRS